jgi:hypothetical protein
MKGFRTASDVFGSILSIRSRHYSSGGKCK